MANWADRGRQRTSRVDRGRPVAAPRTQPSSRVLSADLPGRKCGFRTVLAGRPYGRVQRSLEWPAPPVVLYPGRISATPTTGHRGRESEGRVRFKPDRGSVTSRHSELDPGARVALRRRFAGATATR